MTVIKVKDNESFEQAMKRFKKTCEKAGILTELRRREFYDKPSISKKKKAAAARKRAQEVEAIVLSSVPIRVPIRVQRGPGAKRRPKWGTRGSNSRRDYPGNSRSHRHRGFDRPLCRSQESRP